MVIEFIDHQDVGRVLTLGLLVVFQLQVAVNVIDLAQAILVVLKLLAFNLVVGLLNFVLIQSTRGFDVVHVTVHASANASLKLVLRDLVNFSGALGRVEVGGRKRQDHTVDWQELNAWALLLLVEPQFEVL